MLGWFRQKFSQASRDENARTAVRDALDAVARLGELMELHPTAIYDTTALPFPKAEMKLALKIAWRVAGNDYLRNCVRGAFVSLSMFQDGIGGTPIELPVMGEGVVQSVKVRDGKADATLTKLDQWLSWSDRQQTESEALLREWREFERQQSDH